MLSATLAGAVAGLTVGVFWSLSTLPPLGSSAALVSVVAALVADAVHARSGRFPPLGLHRQVPRAWARLFDVRTAATLFGARLGVGPLTNLTSWLWWAATLLAASRGPGPSAAVGGLFGALRMITVVAVSRHVQAEMPSRMAALRRREGTLLPVLSLVSLGACLVLVQVR